MTTRRELGIEAIESEASAWVVRRDAGLTAKEQAEFDRWMAADARHAPALAAVDRAWSILDRPRRGGAGEWMRRELQARARRRRHRVTGIAAVCSVVMLTSLIFWGWRLRSPALGGIIPTATVVAPIERILDDGSRVDLKTGAEIAVAYQPESRRIELTRGEAHFEVASNGARPFVVSAGAINVVAVGTAFSVQLGQEDVAVLVTEGRVAISPRATGTAPAEPVFVDAGQRLVVARDPTAGARPSVVPVLPPEIDERLAWRKAHLEFTETPLGEAVALLNRYAGGRGTVRITISDPAIAAVPVTGFFRADNLDAFVRLIEASTGIKVERDGNSVVLRPSK